MVWGFTSCVSRKARIVRERTYAHECHERQEIDNGADLDQFHGRKEVADFEGRGFRSVGTVRAIHLDAGAEIVADGASRCFFRVSGAHSFAPFGDGTIGLKDHGEDFAGTHEVREFAEKRTLAMDGVEAAGLFFGEAHGFNGHELEAGFVNP